MKNIVRLFAIVMFAQAALSCYGDDFTDLERACFRRGNIHKGIHWLEECVQESFTAQPYHLALASVAPGAGLAAFGPSLTKNYRVAHLDVILAGTAAVATDGSYLGDAQMTFALPTRGLARLNNAMRSMAKKAGLLGNPEVDPLDSKIAVKLGMRRFDAREQNFYGLGPSSRLSGFASYGLLFNDTYADLNRPLNAWSSLGFHFSFAQPRVTSSINSGAQVRTVYSEATAPGLTGHDDFVGSEPYLTLHIPAHRSLFSDVRIGYLFQHAMGDSHFSFERLSAKTTTNIPLLLPSRGTAGHRGAALNALCPSVRSATRCSLGTVTLNGSLWASYTGANSVVPFYFDQTLGGTDIDGKDTLRGFQDYRFRAPNALLLQAEYRHPLWGPLGLLSFYDTGKVALQRSDLTLSALRHDFGLGIYMHVANREIARLYIGFGTGEGSRVKPKFPTN